MKNTAIEQMELGMRNQIRNFRSVNIRNNRLRRARWWFTQMRRVVDLALPSQPLSSPRPEQTYLRLK